jgi:hypothetical protein
MISPDQPKKQQIKIHRLSINFEKNVATIFYEKNDKTQVKNVIYNSLEELQKKFRINTKFVESFLED